MNNISNRLILTSSFFFFCYLVLFFSFTSEVHAQHTVEAYVSYETESRGFSEYYYREIDLMSGFELNRRTNTRNYSVQSDYALIWFSNDQVAIIELKTIRFSTITNSSISKTAFDIALQFRGLNHEGIDQREVRWKICFASRGWNMTCR